MRVSLFHSFSARDKFSIILLFFSIALCSLNPWIPVIGVFVVTLVSAKRIYFNGMFVLLLFIWLIYDILGLSNGNTSYQMAIYLTISSILFFNLGNYWVTRYASLSCLFLVMSSVIIALALPHILITTYDITQMGLVNPDRHLYILAEDAQRAVTQRTVEMSFCIGSIGLFFQQKEASSIIKMITRILLVFSVLAIICALHFVSRTGVAIMLVSLLLGMLLTSKFSIKTVFFLLLAVLFFSWINSTNLFEIYSARETASSNITNLGLRIPRWEWAWKTIFSNPWGTVNFMSAEHPYAHNLWLDIGKNCGVLPFFMMILFSLKNLLNVWQIVRKKNNILTLVVVLWTAACYMCLFTEAIHEGAPVFMFIYFFFCGLCYRMARSNILIE